MRTKQIAVYKFSELSEEAKERARQDFAASMGFSWGDEYMDSIKALAAHFGGSISDYSIDWFDVCRCSMSFSMPDMTAAEIRERLKQLGTYNRKTGRGHGDCKLTGFCADEEAIDGFRAAWRAGERDLSALMESAYESWIRAACADCESQYSDEQFSEDSDANNYEYYENGELA